MNDSDIIPGQTDPITYRIGLVPGGGRFLQKILVLAEQEGYEAVWESELATSSIKIVLRQKFM